MIPTFNVFQIKATLESSRVSSSTFSKDQNVLCLSESNSWTSVLNHTFWRLGTPKSDYVIYVENPWFTSTCWTLGDHFFHSFLIVKSVSGPLASTTTFQLRGVSAKPLCAWSIKMHIFIPTFHYFSSLNIGCWPLPLPLIYTHRAVNPQSHLFHLGCFHITVIIPEIFKNFSLRPF